MNKTRNVYDIETGTAYALDLDGLALAKVVLQDGKLYAMVLAEDLQALSDEVLESRRLK